MRTNSPLTLYNKYYDTSAKANAYQRKVISAVMWEDRKYSRVQANGERLADYQAMIYVPFSTQRASFLQPREWQALVDKSGNWTLQSGDLVVKGEVADELSAAFTPSDLMRKYDDVLEVMDVETNDMGSYALQHWKLGAS